MRRPNAVPAVVLAGLFLGACGTSPHAATPSGGATSSGSATPSAGAMPRDGASPEDVVRAYVAAVNARDCATARTLASDADAWCGRSTLDDLRITGSTDQTRAGMPSRKVRQVSVEFTLHGGDASMGEGHHQWGYLLDRTGPHGAWRIYDQGVG